MSKEFLDFFGDNKQLRLPVGQTSLGFLAWFWSVFKFVLYKDTHMCNIEKTFGTKDSWTSLDIWLSFSSGTIKYSLKVLLILAFVHWKQE